MNSSTAAQLVLIATLLLATLASADWLVLSNKDIPGNDLPNGSTPNITSADACGDTALAANAYIAVWSSDTATCTLKYHTTPQPAYELYLGHTPSTPPFLGYYDLPGGTGAYTTKMAHMNYFKGRPWSVFQAWSNQCDVWSYTLSERMYRCKKMPWVAGKWVLLKRMPVDAGQESPAEPPAESPVSV